MFSDPIFLHFFKYSVPKPGSAECVVKTKKASVDTAPNEQDWPNYERAELFKSEACFYNQYDLIIRINSKEIICNEVTHPTENVGVVREVIFCDPIQFYSNGIFTQGVIFRGLGPYGSGIQCHSVHGHD